MGNTLISKKHESLFVFFVGGEGDLWIVQLGVRVCNLLGVNKELEAFSEEGLGPVPLGKRGHDLGMFGDEGWVYACRLNEFAHEFVQEACRCVWRRALDLVLRQLGQQILSRLCTKESRSRLD